jgi:tetratricopeptide (TPR) repeat protein
MRFGLPPDRTLSRYVARLRRSCGGSNHRSSSGPIAPIMHRLDSGDHPVARLRRFRNGSNMPVSDRRFDEAKQSYEQRLALDPDYADVHHNLAILFDERGDRRGLIRHLSAYRRLND